MTLRKPRIFLSYPHDRYAELAARIRRDLEAAGYDVWIDTSEIRGGQAWRKRIVDALKRSDVVVAVLTRHAVRPGSICVDEVSLGSNLRRPIIPVLVEDFPDVALPDALPLPVRHLHYVDFRDAVDDEERYRRRLNELVAGLDLDPDDRDDPGSGSQTSSTLRASLSRLAATCRTTTGDRGSTS